MRCTIAICLWFFVQSLPLVAQDEAHEARRMLLQGGDAAVLKAAQEAAAKGPLAAEWLEVAFHAAVNTGAFDSMESYSTAWLALCPQSVTATLARARILHESGKLDAAVALLEPFTRSKDPAPASEPAFDLPATALLAAVRRDAGLQSESDALLERMLDESRRVVLRAPRDLVALAEAYVVFGGPKEAEAVLVEAQKSVESAARAHPETVDLDIWIPTLGLARLYLDQHHLEGDAVEEGKAALLLRKDLAPALGLLGRAYESWQKQEESVAAYTRALSIHSLQPEATLWKAARMLDNVELNAASGTLTEFMQRHPRDLRGLGLLAALALLADGSVAGEAALSRADALRSQQAVPRLMVAEVLSNRRRWSESLAFARAAAALEPSSALAHDAVARYALFLGEDKLAEEALNAAAAAEKFSHVRRKNMSEFVRVVGRYYEDVPTQHLLLRLAKRERAALEPVIAPFAEQSWALLEKKYGFKPQGLDDAGRMRVEVLMSSGDLTARTFALPRVGFLGFCFGPLLTMLSPSALQPGSASWARTLHHELAHSFTLGLSRGRVPRWLTEGLSTYEERALFPAWDRHMDLDLHDAVAAGELIPVRQFEAAFGSPRVVFAYFQAGLAAEWLVQEYGMERMRALLVALGEDKGFAAAAQDVLGLSLDELDRGIATAARARIATLKRIPRLSEQGLKVATAGAASGTADAATLLSAAATLLDRTSLAAARLAVDQVAAKLGAGDPQLLALQGRLAAKAGDKGSALKHLQDARKAGLEDTDIHALLARLLLDSGDTEGAEREMRAAITTFPMNASRTGPRRQLAKLLLTHNRSEEAMQVLSEHVALDSEDLEARAEILKLLAVKGQSEEMLRHLDAQTLVHPIDAQLHLQRGRVGTELKRFAEAEAALRVGLACQPTTTAEADLLAALGEVLLQLGRSQEALSVAEKALALVPEHEIAKDVRRRAGAR
ncbi:MAG: hypothetical protein EXS14_08085 [Planctomycetes bacterium]|nr:hypothetical protein [Planctomycetota bacterium]